MPIPLVKLDTRKIDGWESFHDVFAVAFGFPTFYGRNLDAWIDCMTDLDDPGAGMSAVHCEPGQVVTLLLENVSDFATRCPEQHAALHDCAAFVNWRRIEAGSSAVLALAYAR